MVKEATPAYISASLHLKDLAADLVDQGTLSKSDCFIHSNNLNSNFVNSAMVAPVGLSKSILLSRKCYHSATAFFRLYVTVKKCIECLNEWDFNTHINCPVPEHSCCSNTLCYHYHFFKSFI